MHELGRTEQLVRWTSVMVHAANAPQQSSSSPISANLHHSSPTLCVAKKDDVGDAEHPASSSVVATYRREMERVEAERRHWADGLIASPSLAHNNNNNIKNSIVCASGRTHDVAASATNGGSRQVRIHLHTPPPPAVQHVANTSSSSSVKAGGRMPLRMAPTATQRCIHVAKDCDDVSVSERAAHDRRTRAAEYRRHQAHARRRGGDDDDDDDDDVWASQLPSYAAIDAAPYIEDGTHGACFCRTSANVFDPGVVVVGEAPAHRMLRRSGRTTQRKVAW